MNKEQYEEVSYSPKLQDIRLLGNRASKPEIKTYSQICNECDHRIKEGEIVWGFAYAISSNKEQKILLQEPVRGTFVFSRAVRSCLDEFVPFSKKYPDRLVYSKAVRANNRLYAKTEEDAWSGYQMEILSELKKAEERVNDRLGDFLNAEIQKQEAQKRKETS